MAVRRPVLIALAVSLLLPAGPAQAAQVSCLKCHPSHYRSLGGCVVCHRGDPRSDRVRIAHHDLVQGRYAWFALPGSEPVVRGRRLVEVFACRRCHTSVGKGNRLASNLDRLPRGTTAQGIFAAIKTPALLMPQFHFDERQGTDLVNAILAGERESGQKGAGRGQEAPQVVHFQNGEANRENVFEKRCGACHRLLTRACGRLGRGSIGPNLSGLLSEHYPKTAQSGAPWSPAALEKWLKNPRQSREQTQMRPVALQEGELEKLQVLFTDRPSPPGP